MILSIQMSTLCQSLTENGKVAVPSTNKDTLYILVDMFSSIHYIWNLPENKKEMPVLIAVNSLEPYIGRKEDE